MKKVIAIVFMVLFLLGATACQKTSAPDTSPEYKFGTDCQYYFCGKSGFYTVAESEDCLYVLNQQYLRMVDKKTMISSVLCNKPNCLHDKAVVQNDQERTACNAYVPGSDYLSGTLSYYDGNLYLYQKDSFGIYDSLGAMSLTQISLDGTERKSVWDIQWKETDINGTIEQVLMHRGKAYLILQENPVQDGEYARYRYSIFCYDLKSKKEKLIFRSDYTVMDVELIGNYMYVREIMPDGITYLYHCYNLVTGEVSVLENCMKIIPFGDRLLAYYMHYKVDGKEKTPIYSMKTFSWDLSDEREYTAVDLNRGDKDALRCIQSDGTYLFVTNVSHTSREIFVYEMTSGKEVATLVVPEKVLQWIDNSYRTAITQDGKMIVYSWQGEDLSSTDFFYCFIDQIGTPDFQWYEVEKVN